ncbi:MAG: dTDP-4-dehydrorhamnose reductase [Ignavibacteria bacterium]
MKRILLTARNGQVGWELERTLAPLGEVVAVDRAALDLSNADRVRAVVRDTRPDVIVNAAAYTAVDKAESEPELAMAINGTAPGVFAEEAKRSGALLVHYSTDYVFDGTKQGVYTEADATNPVNTYGRTKLAGEQAIQAVGGRHLILRTTWVYGQRGNNFFRTMLRLANDRPELRVVMDQIGAPTWSRMIAEGTAALLARGEPAEGLFHMTADGETSWHGFAVAILRAAGLTTRVTPITTAEYPTPAARPANSRLDCSLLRSACGIALPDWALQLSLCQGENASS